MAEVAAAEEVAPNQELMAKTWRKWGGLQWHPERHHSLGRSPHAGAEVHVAESAVPTAGEGAQGE